MDKGESGKVYTLSAVKARPERDEIIDAMIFERNKALNEATAQREHQQAETDIERLNKQIEELQRELQSHRYKNTSNSTLVYVYSNYTRRYEGDLADIMYELHVTKTADAIMLIRELMAQNQKPENSVWLQGNAVNYVMNESGDVSVPVPHVDDDMIILGGRQAKEMNMDELNGAYDVLNTVYNSMHSIMMSQRQQGDDRNNAIYVDGMKTMLGETMVYLNALTTLRGKRNKNEYEAVDENV